ncbi:putative membrane protein [Collimonas pratensis]|nr:putative membrane protein [Collimonas pratensis]
MARENASAFSRRLIRRAFMGKYLLAWLLGVPAVVLVVVYLLAH